MLWSAIAINYFDRGNLSVAIPVMAKEFYMSPATMGIVLSAFFWPYFLLQIPAGWFADKVGHRPAFALSVGLWSLATAATALARGAASLVGLRVLLGIGESGGLPCAAGVTAKWFPDMERARVTAIYDSATKVGAAIALPVMAWLILVIGWRGAFIISGAIGLVWTVAWWRYYQEPEKHKYMNAAELKHIRSGQLRHHGIGSEQPMKWYQLLRYRNIWSMCLGLFTLNYVSFFYYTWFPVYLMRVHKLPLMKMGLIATIPLVCAVIAELSGGWFADRLYAKGWPITRVRKLLLVGGLLLGASIIIAVFTRSIVWVITVMAICKSGHAIASSQQWSLIGDIAPTNMTSQVGGLQNMMGNLAGVLGPIVTGFVVQVTQSFDLALLIIGAIAVLGAVNYLFIFGKVEPIQVKASNSEGVVAT
jgi:MFS family permease